MLPDIFKIIIPSVITFLVGIAITPFISHYLYKYKAWKKKPGKVDIAHKKDTPIYNSLDRESQTYTPRFGGLIIWLSVIIVALSIWILAVIFPNSVLTKIDFISRSQTWIPLAVLLIGSVVGFVDDFFTVQHKGGLSGGLPLRLRVAIVAILGVGIGWWFYEKLDVVTLGIPFGAELFVGPWLILVVVLVMSATYAGGVIDGIDGLAGGVFASAFASYGVIAFLQDQINVAAFCIAVVGGILAFLWFNIPPARFYMSETGTMGLTLSLAVVALMTDSLAGGNGILLLPVVGFLLVITVASDIIQLFSKKIRKKKIFLSTPVHHTFQAIGWPDSKVTMRYWVIAAVAGAIGVLISLVA